MLGMEAEMLKGHLDAIVLAAFEAGPAHGYAIIETIRQRSAGTFDLPEGTVYPALHRLEQAGLLSSAWTTPPGGRRRRVYSLTKAGSAALAQRPQGRGLASEVEDHLRDAAEADPAWPSPDAERRAVERFGVAREIAAQFAAEAVDRQA